MNNWLQMMRWKTPFNRWDKEEIICDIKVIAGAIVIIGIIVYFQ